MPVRRKATKAEEPAKEEPTGEPETKTRKSERVAEKTEAAAASAAQQWQKRGSLLVLDPFSGAGGAGSTEIVSFDMDDTLITTKSGKVFATGRSDWKWLFDEVPATLRKLHAEGKKLVIFTNQSGIDGKGGYDVTKERAICGKMDDMIAELGIPVQCFIATTDDVYRKPATAMWDYMVANNNGGTAPDLTKCIFVGDAAGRPAVAGKRKGKKDFSCSDRKFAYNVGIGFRTPEMFFLGEGEEEFDWDSADLTKVAESGDVCDGGVASLTSSSQEMVLMCGFPASGKSTFSKTYLVPKGYFHVNRDTLNTQAKCQKAAREALKSGQSVVIDNTNPDSATREEYIQIARDAGVPVRCFWMQTDEQLAQHLNYFRERTTNGESEHVPRIAYCTFKKKFQPPTVAEGFTEVKKINFIANNFPSAEAKKSFFQLH